MAGGTSAVPEGLGLLHSAPARRAGDGVGTAARDEGQAEPSPEKPIFEVLIDYAGNWIIRQVAPLRPQPAPRAEPPSARAREDEPEQWQSPPAPADPPPGPILDPQPREPQPDYLRFVAPPGTRRARGGPPPLGPNPAARGMDPLSPAFTSNLVRQTRQTLDGMDRVMRPGGIATPEGLSAASRAGMQHLAAHNGNISAAITSAKAAGMGADSNFARFINASDEPPEFKPPEVPIQAFPPINEELQKALEEEGFSPEEARELAEGDAAVALGILFFSWGKKFPAAGSAGISPEEPIRTPPPAEGAATAVTGSASKPKTAVAKTAAPPTQLQMNVLKGRAFEQKGLDYLNATQTEVRSQVSIRPFVDVAGTLADYTVRLDAISMDKNGEIQLTDFKSSDTAGLTPNQTTGYPLIKQFGGQLVGGNGGEVYPSGAKIPPTAVKIITPGDL